MKLHLFFATALIFFGLTTKANEVCEQFVEQKVTTENALPGAIVRVNAVIRNGIASGERGALQHLRAYVEPGGVFEGGFGAPPGVELEILAAPKKTNSINTIRVKDIASGKVGYVFWVEFKASTTLIKPSSEPAAPPKVKADKIQFPEKARRNEFESLATVGQNVYGRSFAKIGQKVWVANSNRKMSKFNVGELVAIEIPLVPGNWNLRGHAAVKTLGGNLVHTTHYDCTLVTDEEYERVATSP